MARRTRRLIARPISARSAPGETPARPHNSPPLVGPSPLDGRTTSPAHSKAELARCSPFINLISSLSICLHHPAIDTSSGAAFDSPNARAGRNKSQSRSRPLEIVRAAPRRWRHAPRLARTGWRPTLWRRADKSASWPGRGTRDELDEVRRRASRAEGAARVATAPPLPFGATRGARGVAR